MTISESIDLACFPLFHEMHRRGIRVDIGRMETLLADVRAQMAAISLPFNPASGDEVAEWMRHHGLSGKMTKGRKVAIAPSIYTIKGGRLATDERSLSAHNNPVLNSVLEYRGLQKLEGTFILPTLDIVYKTGGYVHPQWKLTRVKSGRVACEDPNLLAFPSRDAMGKRVRGCFVPRPGMRMASIDFSQIEPRILAALSRDEALLDVFINGHDLYTSVATRLGVERQVAKIVTLGVLYGMGARRLYEQLVLAGNGHGTSYDVEACERLISGWFDTYPGVKMLVARVLAEARRNGGWTSTHFGRGRYLPALFVTGSRWPAAKLREEAERQAFNHLIQGSAQEQMKLAQIRVSKQVPEAYPLLQIHDELVIEVAEEIAESVAEQAAEVMSTEFLGVRLKTEWKIGDSWGAIK